MKKVIFILLTIASLFFECKKKDEIDWSQYQGSGYLLGITWQASRVDFTLEANNTLAFGLSAHNEFHELRQQISFMNLNVSKDTIFLKYWKRSTNWVTDSIVPLARDVNGRSF